ncbi:hypothetical protein VP01_3430g1 [Puccinia sorghi]|uniref:Uncharacterized protein n=1 Tax=Puccinia sorghi TaxID=27349 RepID=A0A0L6UWD8_9BASI|nr:hypothetical protein VP01_3430g1 [Puccinia sorghi]
MDSPCSTVPPNKNLLKARCLQEMQVSAWGHGAALASVKGPAPSLEAYANYRAIAPPTVLRTQGNIGAHYRTFRVHPRPSSHHYFRTQGDARGVPKEKAMCLTLLFLAQEGLVSCLAFLTNQDFLKALAAPKPTQASNLSPETSTQPSHSTVKSEPPALQK